MGFKHVEVRQYKRIPSDLTKRDFLVIGAAHALMKE
jgi:hypothetical protein